MTREEVIAGLQRKFAAHIADIHEKSSKRVYVTIKREGLIAMALHLFRTLGARFNIASGVDVPGGFEVLYHFIIEDLNLLVSLRVGVSKEDPVIDSLAPHIPAVNWIEREMNELLGIEFRGHPDMRRLLLSDEWPQGVYPLRQDYREWDATAVRDRGV